MSHRRGGGALSSVWGSVRASAACSESESDVSRSPQRESASAAFCLCLYRASPRLAFLFLCQAFFLSISASCCIYCCCSLFSVLLPSTQHSAREYVLVCTSRFQYARARMHAATSCMRPRTVCALCRFAKAVVHRFTRIDTVEYSCLFVLVSCGGGFWRSCARARMPSRATIRLAPLLSHPQARVRSCATRLVSWVARLRLLGDVVRSMFGQQRGETRRGEAGVSHFGD